MSRLGAKWLEWMEQKRNIALKHSKASVATPTRGPNRMISSRRWTNRWSLIFSTIFVGSIMANMSRTFAAAISMSSYGQIQIMLRVQRCINGQLPGIHPGFWFLGTTTVLSRLRQIKRYQYKQGGRELHTPNNKMITEGEIWIIHVGWTLSSGLSGRHRVGGP